MRVVRPLKVHRHPVARLVGFAHLVDANGSARFGNRDLGSRPYFGCGATRHPGQVVVRAGYLLLSRVIELNGDCIAAPILRFRLLGSLFHLYRADVSPRLIRGSIHQPAISDSCHGITLAFLLFCFLTLVLPD